MSDTALVLIDIIKGIAKDAASALPTTAKEYITDKSLKAQIDNGDAYEIYLTTVYDTYCKSKSLVYGNEAKELSSFFEPVDLQAVSDLFGKTLSVEDFETGIRVDKVSSNDLAGLFNNGTKIVVTGIGGAGKTILMKHFCLRSIDVMHKIPVFISLRWFNTWSIDDKEKREEPFEKLVFEQLKVFNFKLSYDNFLYSLEGNRYIFLLDGFDEIAGDRSALLSYKLSDFTRKYKDNYFIISSRYNERIIGLDEFKWFSIRPLSFEQVKGLINKLEFDPDITNRFIADLSNGTYYKYESFVSIPLLLSILFITYVEKTTIPESLNDFYEEAFATLLYRHDKRKVGLQRLLDSGLSYEKFKKLFLRFCYDTYFGDQYSFKESQLVSSISQSAKRLAMEVDSHKYKNDLMQIACMIIQDGREFIFIHRNFQEYFAALFVSQGLDDQQRQLYISMVENIDLANIFLYQAAGTKIFDFLRTLYSIEPKRFEHIFILPILENLNSIYSMNNNDILLTIKAFFFPYMLDDYKDKPAIIHKSKQRVIHDAVLLNEYLCVLNPSMKMMMVQLIDDGMLFIRRRDPLGIMSRSFSKFITMVNQEEHFVLDTKYHGFFELSSAIVQQALWLFQDIKQKEAKYSSSIDFKDIF